MVYLFKLPRPVPLGQVVKKREDEEGETPGEKITVTISRQLARNIYKMVMDLDRNGMSRETYKIIIDKRGNCVKIKEKKSIGKEIVSNKYARIIELRNEEDQDLVLLELDYYKSPNSSEEVTHEIVEGEVELYYTSYLPWKSYWKNYYLVRKTPILVVSKRITSSGDTEEYRLEWKS